MVKNNRCIILANGKPPAKSVLTFLNTKGYSILICADGGANSARKMNVLPNYIIGDLDSTTKDTLNYFAGKSKIIKIKRQNDTDVEKCIKFAIRIIAENSFLAPYTGNANLKTCSGETISLYGFNSKTRIISEGLCYPLKNISLPFGIKESTSNLAVGNAVKLRITYGVIFVIRDFKTAIKHDLF